MHAPVLHDPCPQTPEWKALAMPRGVPHFLRIQLMSAAPGGFSSAAMAFLIKPILSKHQQITPAGI